MIRIAHAPHRIFFFTGGVHLLVASAWWAWSLAARVRGLPSPLAEGLDPVRIHAFLMIYGFFPLFAFGYLFAAAPGWLGRAPLARAEYLPPALVAFASTALLYPALAVGGAALAAACALMLVAWLWIAGRLVQLVAQSAAPDRTHAFLALTALSAGAVGLAAMLADLVTPVAWTGPAMETIGLWMFLVPLFCVAAHRVLASPAPEASAVSRPAPPAWVLLALVGASLAHGVLALAGLAGTLWVVDAPLGLALGAALASRRARAVCFSSRTTTMLLVGAGWLALACLLSALQSAAHAAGYAVLGLAPVHALGVGFLASLTIALVTRVSRGHSGGALAHDRATWNAFWLLQAAAVARVAASLWLDHYGALLLGAAVLWLACFAAWSWRYFPIYWMPRIDGRPG